MLTNNYTEELLGLKDVIVTKVEEFNFEKHIYLTLKVKANGVFYYLLSIFHNFFYINKQRRIGTNIDGSKFITLIFVIPKRLNAMAKINSPPTQDISLII